jgi:uncharacterized membrane protein
VDATNPLAPGLKGLAVGTHTSGAEELAKLAHGARVVKAFNTTGAENMADTTYPQGMPWMPVCGDDAQARERVMALATLLGFDAVDMGALRSARYLEPFAMAWIHLANFLEIHMHKARLEAFSDGVIAIIITIMVLEIKVPHGEQFAQLLPLWPKFISYVLSFIYIGIYWNNHHHTMQAAKTVSSEVLWTNLHLLFWLSLLPFSTGWMGENNFAQQPTLLYGVNLFCAAAAYYLWARALVAHHGTESPLAQAFGKDYKGKLSLVLYGLGMALTFVAPWLGFATFSAVALMWLIPDRRMHKAI